MSLSPVVQCAIGSEITATDSPSLCVSVDGMHHVQHGEARVPAAGQSPPGEHLGGSAGLQLQAGGGPPPFWERGRPWFRAPPQRTGLPWRGEEEDHTQTHVQATEQ